MELCQEMQRHSCHKITAHYKHITVLWLKEREQLTNALNDDTYFELSTQVA